MKKIIALLLVAVMCLSFVACGNTEVNDASTNDNSKEKNEIVGTWSPSNDSVLAGYTIVFNEEGGPSYGKTSQDNRGYTLRYRPHAPGALRCRTHPFACHHE